jgi:hypothetical protein
MQAQQTYLQEHLNIPGYLSSKECELADNLTMAFSANDLEKLEKAKRSTEMSYLDYEVQKLGRELSLFDDIYTSDEPVAPKPVAPKPVAPKPAASTSGGGGGGVTPPAPVPAGLSSKVGGTGTGSGGGSGKPYPPPPPPPPPQQQEVAEEEDEEADMNLDDLVIDDSLPATDVKEHATQKHSEEEKDEEDDDELDLS